MIKNTIRFESSARKDILDIFNKTIDPEGFIVEKDNPEQRVLSIDGDEVQFNRFAGLKRGSEIFIKSDIISLIELSDRLK